MDICAQLDTNSALNLLNQTEGFHKLSSFQQRLIRLSLYVQSRRDRDARDDTYLYKISSRHIANSYCHSAVYNLESGLPIALGGIPNQDIPDSFFEAEHQQVSSVLDVYELVQNQGFPCIGHISEVGSSKKSSLCYHTYLALGYNPQGQILVWEKQGYCYPYRIVPIEAQFEYYDTSMYWGVRPLRHPSFYH